LTDISGTVTADSQNGPIKVTMDSVNGSKPLAFSTLNGVVDLTFPPTQGQSHRQDQSWRGLQRFRRDAGRLARHHREERHFRRPVYRIRIDNTIRGSINGGGVDLTIRTFNGAVYIRKKK
jgi:DUF4097 and DUF4098 domain-containing protein YvlB